MSESTKQIITHIDHRGCECGVCSTVADNRHDALAIIQQAINEGGDQILLGSVAFHVEERMPLAWKQGMPPYSETVKL